MFLQLHISHNRWFDMSPLPVFLLGYDDVFSETNFEIRRDVLFFDWELTEKFPMSSAGQVTGPPFLFGIVLTQRNETLVRWGKGWTDHPPVPALSDWHEDCDGQTLLPYLVMIFLCELLFLIIWNGSTLHQDTRLSVSMFCSSVCVYVCVCVRVCFRSMTLTFTAFSVWFVFVNDGEHGT